ncbi:hypothetical protein GOP47_0003035 [Adiantum capillus-veneris]|uniref:Cytochrome P450 n=1 Tax=Adiantum capillus-veneris TaxID=13818 RepID=A0A9D4VD74_ADICA|nr:hypothetical protein GOP47_0003035 [Adiantum capillus-veneris]
MIFSASLHHPASGSSNNYTSAHCNQYITSSTNPAPPLSVSSSGLGAALPHDNPSALIVIFSSLLHHAILPLIHQCCKSFSTASSLALAVLFSYACYRFWIHRKEHHDSRDPKTWPILGSQLEASRNYDRLLDWTTSFFSDGHRTIKMSFLSRRSYYTVDPANVEHILKTNFQNYPKGSESYHRLFDLLGNGILNADGKTWKMHRKLGSLEFSIKKLRHLSSTVYKGNALKLLEVLAQSNQGVDVQDLLLDMTFHSICEVVFGNAFKESDNAGEKANSIAAMLDNAQEMITRRYIYPWWRIQRLFNIGSEKVFREDITRFKSFLTTVIDRRRSQMQKEATRSINKVQTDKAIEEAGEAQDLLSRFLLHCDGVQNACEGEGEGIEMVKDAMMSFVLAGRDTTASTLSWFLYCMCTHPDEQEKVFQELIKLENNIIAGTTKSTMDSNMGECHDALETISNVDVNGSETDGARQRKMRDFAEKVLNYETLQSSSIPYLHSAIAETLRLYPAVPRDGKVTLQDDILPDGTHLKAGDQVAYIPYAMGRMPFLWGPDALLFKPQRWLQHGAFQPQSPFKFTAFQAGPRMCLGKDAAYLQIKITAALLLRFFHFELVPNHPVEYRMMNVMTLKHGLRVNVVARHIKET